MATTDRARLDELTQMVQTWVWALDYPSAIDFVRRANLDVVRNQIHRERTASIERGVIDKWTMDWSEGFVLPKLDDLVSDRDNKRGIFSVSNCPVWYRSSPDTEGGPFWFRGGIETKPTCPVPGCGADFLDEWYSDPGDPEASEKPPPIQRPENLGDGDVPKMRHAFLAGRWRPREATFMNKADLRHSCRSGAGDPRAPASPAPKRGLPVRRFLSPAERRRGDSEA